MPGIILLLTLSAAAILSAQETPPEWQIKAGGKMSFEVASIKLSQPGEFTPPPFPLDAGDGFTPTGGRFMATFPLEVYLQFAYKVQFTPDQLRAMIAPLPKWVETDRFMIEARAQGNPTKDQFRLMTQSLLADRFRLEAHFETKVVPVFAMILNKPGKTGPSLRPHGEGPPCDKTGPMPVVSAGPPNPSELFPPTCNAYILLKGPTGIRAGARDTGLEQFAVAIAGFSGLGRPVVDQTGLTGKFDFVLTWMPDVGPLATRNADSPAEPQAPTFLEALREQLGLKLEPAKAPVRTLVIDHVERPSEN